MTDLLWKQYSLHIELYKFYLEIVIKLNLFYYAITGPMLSFYFSRSNESLLKYSLILPVAMSIALGIFFIYGIRRLKVVRQDVFNLRDQLSLSVAPDLNVLSYLLLIFSILFFLVASFLLVIIFK